MKIGAKIGVVLAALLLASAGSAFAEGPYLGASGGLTVVHDSDITGSEILGKGTLSYNPGYGFNLAAGYDARPVRLEFEFGYKDAKLKDISDATGVGPAIDNHLTVLSYMVNGYLDLYTGSPIVPFVGAGVGLLDADVKPTDASFHTQDTEFGYQLTAGLTGRIDRNLNFDVFYRLQAATTDFSISGHNLSYMSSNVFAGLRLSFW